MAMGGVHSPLVARPRGAVLTAIAIYVPCYLSVGLAAP